MNEALSAKLKQLPRSPGVYFHKSKSGEIIYVGKAAVLKNRVRQYFQDSRNRDVKTAALVMEIYDTDWVETESEIDALFLESEMVKRYMPRYNVLLRDDKSQSFVRIDMKSDWPTVSTTRNPADDGAEYYGPFYNGFALKKALRYLRRVYPYFLKKPDPKSSRLMSQIGLDPAIDGGSDAYKANLRKLISYIKGHRVALMRELEAQMKAAADDHDFEQAAVLRNRLNAMRELQRRVMFGDREFLDISKDRALSDLTELFGLATIPRRIEGFDISHHGGQNVVASMVVFTNGVSDRAEYRKFKMTKQTNDDPAQIYETISRRFSEKNRKSWGVPDLLLIDGGKQQLRAAIDASRERGVEVPIISIAKREEEIVIDQAKSNIDEAALRQIYESRANGVGLYEEGDYLILNLHVGRRNASGHSRNLRGSDVVSAYDDIIKLFQRIRDESHRFAISYHETLKRTRQVGSKLDMIPGVGPVTKRKLLTHFGSVKSLTEAEERQIAEVVGPAKAKEIYNQLRLVV